MKSINLVSIIFFTSLLGCNGAWEGHEIEVSGAVGFDSQSACQLKASGLALKAKSRSSRANKIQMQPRGAPRQMITKVFGICDFEVTKSSVQWIKPGSLTLYLTKDIPNANLPKGNGKIAYVIDEKGQDPEDMSGIGISGPALDGSFRYGSTKVEITLQYSQDTIRTATFRGTLRAHRSGL